MRRIFVDLAHFAPERRRDGWTGVEKVDVATALDAVPGRHFLLDTALFPRPARAPLLHLDDALRPIARKPAARSSSLHRPRPAFNVSSRCSSTESGSAAPSATATVICAMIVAPPRPTWPLSTRSTEAPSRAAAIAAYIPAPPAPTTSTSVESWGMTDSLPRRLEILRRNSIHGLFAAFLQLLQGLLRRFLFGLFFAPTFAYAENFTADGDLRDE